MTHRRTLISILLMSTVACGGSRKPGVQPIETRFLPTPAEKCVRQPPPVRPQLLPCQPAQQPCGDLNLAAALDYLVALDHWKTIVVAECGL